MIKWIINATESNIHYAMHEYENIYSVCTDNFPDRKLGSVHYEKIIFWFKHYHKLYFFFMPKQIDKTLILYVDNIVKLQFLLYKLWQ